jgi:hypothetical protein
VGKALDLAMGLAKARLLIVLLVYSIGYCWLV